MLPVCFLSQIPPEHAECPPACEFPLSVLDVTELTTLRLFCSRSTSIFHSPTLPEAIPRAFQQLPLGNCSVAALLAAAAQPEDLAGAA